MSSQEALVVVINWLALSISTGLLVVLAFQPRRERLNVWLAVLLVALDVWAYFAMARTISDLSPLSETHNFYVLFTGLALIPVAWYGFVVMLTQPRDGFGPLLALWGPLYVVITALLLWVGVLLRYTETGGDEVDFAFKLPGIIAAVHIGVYLILAYLYLHISKDKEIKPLRVPALLLIVGYATNTLPALRLPPLGIALTALAALYAGVWILRRQLFTPLKAIQAELTVANRDLRQALGELEVERNRREQLADELRDAGRYKGEFLTNMGHEIRTPLNSIVGYSELLLNGVYGILSEKQQDRVEKIHRNGNNLLALIHDILDLSKIEGGRMELNITTVRIAPLAESVLESVADQVRGKPLVLETVLEPPLRLIHADEMRVRQLLLELLTNAIMVTAQGHVRLGARSIIVKDGKSAEFLLPVVGWLEDGAWLLLSVEDTGAGIPPEQQAAIFDEFSQGRSMPTREQGRTGLGLAIARKLVELHGGRIWVRSKSGQGSTFYAAFPALDTFDTAAVPDAAAPFTTLVVSHDDTRAERLSATVDATNPRVVRVTDAPACLARAHELHPGAVIIDLLLPDLIGWDTLRQMATTPGVADVPLTLAAVIGDMLFSIPLEPLAVLTKPVQRDDVLPVLARFQRTEITDPVIVIDDDPDERALLCNFLSGESIPLVPCGTARAACEWLSDSAHRPGLVLLDVLMADVNSVALLNYLRTTDRLRDVPVVLLMVEQPAASERATLDDQVQHVLRGDRTLTTAPGAAE